MCDLKTVSVYLEWFGVTFFACRRFRCRSVSKPYLQTCIYRSLHSTIIHSFILFCRFTLLETSGKESCTDGIRGILVASRSERPLTCWRNDRIKFCEKPYWECWEEPIFVTSILNLVSRFIQDRIIRIRHSCRQRCNHCQGIPRNGIKIFITDLAIIMLLLDHINKNITLQVERRKSYR